VTISRKDLFRGYTTNSMNCVIKRNTPKELMIIWINLEYIYIYIYIYIKHTLELFELYH